MNIKEKFREKLADIEHQRWSDWQSWCHKILRQNCPSLELEKVLELWDEQIAISYKDLSEGEKESDREQVDRYLPLILEKLAEQKEKEVEITKNSILMSKSGWIEQGRNELKEEIQTLLNREIAIAHKEGTPTSRLTSLSMKIKQLT